MRVKFKKDFNWSPPESNGRITIFGKAGVEDTVRKEMGEAAIAAGAAEEVREKPSRPQASAPQANQRTGERPQATGKAVDQTTGVANGRKGAKPADPVRKPGQR